MVGNNNAPSLAPIGELVQQLLKLPQELVISTTPDIQQQIRELPEIVKLNAQHIMKQFQEIPTSLSKQASELTKS